MLGGGQRTLAPDLTRSLGFRVDPLAPIGLRLIFGVRRRRGREAAFDFFIIPLYLAIMISKPDVEDLNHFADTLMFGGILLVASRAYDVPRKSRIS